MNKTIGNRITGYPYFSGDNPISKYQHLLKDAPYHYTDGELDGYIYDHSRNHGTPRLPRPAYVGVFDGSTNYAYLPGRLTNGSITEISVTAWVKPASYAQHIVIASEWTDATNNRGWVVYIEASTGNLSISTTSNGINTYVNKTTTPLSLNTLQHIAAVFNNGVISLYINGVSQNFTTTGTLTSSIYNGSEPFTIGCHNYSTTPKFKFYGSLSDVRIYSSTKSSDEILAIYEGDHTYPDINDLLAAYALEEESGTILYDWSGNGNDLTISGTMTNFWAVDTGKTWSYVDSMGYTPVGPNLLTHSEQFDNAGWTKITSAVTANQSESPSGALTADKFKPSSGTTGYIRQPSVMEVGKYYTFSIYAKAAEWSRIRLQMSDGVAASYAYFNVATGELGATSDAISSYMEEVADGIYRCQFTKLAGGTGVDGGHRIYTTGSANTLTNGDGTSGIYIFGAQVQEGLTATEYSRTVDSNNTSIAIMPRKIGNVATYVGRTPYPGLNSISVMQGNGTDSYVSCGSNLIPATDDFIVECWYYHTTNAATARGVFAQRLDAGIGRLSITANVEAGVGWAGGHLSLFVDGTTDISFSIPAALIQNTWHKIRLVRESNTFTMYCKPLGGVELSATQTQSGITVNMEGVTRLLFADATSPYYNNGKIADFSVTTGGVKYTVVPELNGDRIWVMGDNGSSTLVDGAIIGTLTDVHQTALLPAKDWHLEHGGHIGTNLLLYSEVNADPVWQSIAGSQTVASEYSVAPNGTTTAERITFNANLSTRSQIYSTTVEVGDVYTGSIWVKNATSGIFLRVARAYGGTYEVDTLAIPVSSEWQRIEVTHTFLYSQLGVRFDLYNNNGGDNATIEVWGAQLNPGSVATPYIPTTSSLVTDVHVPANYNNLAPDGDNPYYIPGSLMANRVISPRANINSGLAQKINLESTYTAGNERDSVEPLATKRNRILSSGGRRDFIAYKDVIPLSGDYTEEGLTLDHQYTQSDYAVVGPELAFSRASGAMMFNSAGELVWGPENLQTYSEDLSNAIWSKSRCTATINQLTAPDGAITVDRLDCNTTNINGMYVLGGIITTLSARNTVSAYFQKGYDDFALINFYDNTTNGVRQWFNLANGTLGSSNTAGSGFSKYSATIEPWGNGYRCTLTANTTGETIRAGLYPSVPADLDFDCTSGVTYGYVWGAQIYRSPNASSDYIPTTSAAVYGMRLASHVYENGSWVNKGLLVESASTNKCTNYNANPTDLTRASKAGDEASILTIVNDAAALTSAGLSGICTNGNVFKLDNSAGSTDARVSIGGTAGNTNDHTASCWVRGSGTFTLRTGYTAPQNSTFTLTDNYTYRKVHQSDGLAAGSKNAGDVMWVVASAGSIVYFILNQYEEGSIATSPIITPGTTMTRSVDTPTMGGADFASFYNQDEGTWLIEVGTISSVTGSSRRVLGVNNGGGAERFLFYVYIDDYVSTAIFDGNIMQASIMSTVNEVDGKGFTQSCAYKLNDIAMSVNGENVLTDTSATMPTVDRLIIGSEFNINHANCHLKSLKYYSKRKANSFLQSASYPYNGELALDHQYNNTNYNMAGPDIEFSRSSGATMNDSNGTVVWAPENLLTQSGDFSILWSKTDCELVSVVNINRPPIDEEVFAIIENTANNRHRIFRNFSVTAGQKYELSLYVKQGNGNRFVILNADAAINAKSGFNISTGSDIYTSTGSASMEDVGNGWYRISVSGTASNTTTTQIFIQIDDDGTTDAVYTGDGASYIYISGVQMSRYPNASSAYIPTTTDPIYGMRLNSYKYEDGQWVNRGVRIEGAATNLLTYSNDLSNAAWSKTDITLGATTIGPNGIDDVPLVTEGTVGSAILTHNSITVSSGATIAYSVSLKYSNQQWLRVRIANGDSDAVNTWVDVLNGVIGSIAVAGNGVAGTSSIVKDGHGFWRYTFSGSITGVTTYLSSVLSASGNLGYLRVDNAEYYVANAQMELGDTSTTYIPTTSAAVTRAADSLSITGDNFASFYNDDEGTWAVDFISVPTTEVSALYTSSGTVNESVRVGSNSSGIMYVYSRAAGVTDGFLAMGSHTTDPNKVATSYSSSLLEASRNSKIYNDDSALAKPTGINRLYVGYGHTGYYIDGFVKSVKYYNTRKPKTFLNSLTQPDVETSDDLLSLDHQYTMSDYAVVGPELEFSRDSGATMHLSDGSLGWAPENLLKYSQDFSNAVWLKYGTTSITSNAITAPDGTLTADLISRGSANSYSGQVLSAFKLDTPIKYTYTIYAKKNVEDYFAMRAQGQYPSRVDATFNLATGRTSITAYATSNFSSPSSTIESVGDGWYRLSLTFISDSITNIATYFSPTDLPNRDIDDVVTATDLSAYVWGAQLQRSPSSSYEYIPTTANAVYNMRLNAYNYETDTWVNRGLLVEGEATNLCSYSRDFSNVYWTKTESSVATDGTISIDGFTQAYKIKTNTNNAEHSIMTPSNISITSGATYTTSCIAKAAEKDILFLSFGSLGFTSPTPSFFNLTTGSVVAGSGCTASMTSLGNGWWLCKATKTATGTTPWHGARYGVTESTASSTSTGSNATDGLYIIDVQFEVGFQATSRIPTTSTSITRSADDPMLTSSNFSSIWNAEQGTVFMEILHNNTTTNVSISITDGTLNNRLSLVGTNSGSGVQTRLGYGGVEQYLQSVNGLPFYGLQKIAYAYQVGSAQMAANGTLASPGNVDYIPAVSRLILGYQGAYTYPLNGFIQSLRVYSNRKSNTLLQSMTE